MTIVEDRSTTRFQPGTPLRALWIGLVLTSPLLGACDDAEAGWRLPERATTSRMLSPTRSDANDSLPLDRNGDTAGLREHCRSCDDTSVGGPAVAETVIGGRRGSHSAGAGPLAIGELPDVTVAARRLGLCARAPGDHAARVPVDAEPTCGGSGAWVVAR